jgi:hypothetical protein
VAVLSVPMRTGGYLMIRLSHTVRRLISPRSFSNNHKRTPRAPSFALTSVSACCQVLPTAKEPPKPPSVWVALPSEDANWSGMEQWSTPATYFASVISH